MPQPGFDALIHAPTRLSIMAFLIPLDWAEFRLVRDEVGLSDSALSKQITTLEEAGYLEVKKEFQGKRPRTSVRVTDAGRTAFEGHLAALRGIVGDRL
ncbi:winged helix-turn-helix domain-containing protein [Stackebrandtia nassauensis]|uniref:Transcriptional regulator, MarR/EmrR family protein n=1 Tax=Stackebrandtia nassauensis (strain DSM 44728 / CIP 108903 / NRRL B-16338 / NBRC 102104 / LLR-40K-21) TaxID=446470 RepID=D3Q356_STANL|nr:transcriptional regulator [Stackebrandtia nassauensis]ADD40026.1 transcriptional regulator, MarR/EmrR family protein [Stackebrandtia nassauensis DSM 44728]